MAAPPITITQEKPQPVSRSGPRPAQRAAAVRVQRYLNKASGRMETPQQMRNYRAQPQGHPGHPAHNGGRPTPQAAPTRGPVSFINMTVPEIEGRAKRIVQAELGGLRAPFQQQQTLLGQEQTHALEGNTAAYGRLDQGTAAQQTQQAASAKTFENYAADAITKAGQAAPGAQAAGERLGLKPGQALPQSSQQTQENARTLLSGLALAQQTGTTARQQDEANFLTNLRAANQQGGVEAGNWIQSQFGKQKADVAGKEAALVAKAGGTQAKLTQTLLGEQEKDRIAAGGLGIKTAEAGAKIANYNSQAARRAAQTREGGIKLAQGATKLAQSGRKLALEEKGAPVKRRKEESDIAKNEAEIKKLLGEAGGPNGPGGKPLTTNERDTKAGEIADVFNVYKRARENGASPEIIREALTRGYFRRPGETVNGKQGKAFNEKTIKVKNALWIDMAEQIMQKEYIDAPTKQRLRGEGLRDSGWSNILLGSRGAYPTTPVTGTKGGVGPKKKK